MGMKRLTRTDCRDQSEQEAECLLRKEVKNQKEKMSPGNKIIEYNVLGRKFILILTFIRQ